MSQVLSYKAFEATSPCRPRLRVYYFKESWPQFMREERHLEFLISFVVEKKPSPS
jgi:hypothetical protein